MASGEQRESERYRVIVLGRGGTEVLLVPNGERQLLPWVEIPRWQRVAENLTTAVKSDWGEEIVCLFEQRTGSWTDAGLTRYHAAEHQRTCRSPKMPTHWAPLATLRQHSSIETRDYEAIKQVAGRCNGEIQGMSTGPFERLGWFNELRNWIESVIEPMGFHLTGKFEQLNASASFSLMRFETKGPALWFKAVGEPNQREFAITSTLTRFFPEYLPRIFASRPDWNGWLAREVEGKLLSELDDLATWELAAGALARLQIESIDRGSLILGAGARDLGLNALSELIQPFMSIAAQLMERQKEIPPSVLNREDLRGLTDSLFSSIEAMETIGIPDAAGNLDLNPDNIIVAENRTAFLDWAGAYVGNPLLSLEYLLQYARRTFGADPAIEDRLTRAYCAPWGDVVSPAAFADASAFAPLLAVFVNAVGTEAWKRPEQLQEPACAGYLRSLARRMDREAHRLADRSILCLQ